MMWRRIGHECGQKWYRRSSWQIGFIFRKLVDRDKNVGFAVGPIMFFYKGY